PAARRAAGPGPAPAPRPRDRRGPARAAGGGDRPDRPRGAFGSARACSAVAAGTRACRGEGPERATTAPGTAGRSSADAWSDDDGVRWTVAEDDPAVRAAARRERLLLLPVDGGFSDDQTRQLGDVDVDELNRALRRLPVDGCFAPD